MSTTAPVLALDDAHVYRLDGQVIPGCTEVIRAAGLMDYDGAPEDVMERARWRGSAVHRACWFDDEGTLDEEKLAAEVWPYLLAWRAAKDTLGITITSRDFLAIEAPIYHAILRYGVTPDRLIRRPDGMCCAIDLKTGSLQPWMAIQLAAQVMAVGGSWYHRIACRLAPSRTPPFIYRIYPRSEIAADFAVFQGALAIYNWKAARK